MIECIINFLDGTKKESFLKTEENESKIIGTLEENLDFEKVDFIDVLINKEPIKSGDEGFFLMSGGWWNSELHDVALGYYKERENSEYINYDPHLYVVGINHNKSAYIAIAKGMKEVSHQKITVKNNEYSFYLRYKIDGEIPYEKISVEIRNVGDDLSYSAMGREYRKYILKNGFVSLKDRLTPMISYAAESMCIRVRQAWKPVPCTVLEQTEENEPPVHVACTFSDVEELMRAYKEAGIEKAEFCLVGWNMKGHDGRWPQILPPEETLGGEDGLRRLISTAKELGYTICCHTNSTDAYRIANNFSEDDIALKKDGTFSIEAERWGGGRTYNICPKRAYEISKETLAPVAELGFYGTHYIDVITATPPRVCYSDKHPVNRKEACEYFDKLFSMSRDMFGAIGCEVGMEHSMRQCDFILYATMNKGLDRMVDKNITDFFEEYVPFWHIVFHGIVLNNPYAGTVNAMLHRNPDALLRLIELGGRPVVYYYSKFVTDGSDWMGDIDFRVDTKENFDSGVLNAKKTAELYKEYSYLQYEFMEEHKKIADNCYKITYSDGSEITVDYNKKTYSLKKGNKS